MNGEKTRLMARNFRRNFSLLQVCLICLILGPFTTLCLASSNIRLGIDYLQDREFDILQNKRVGLLTHPAGVNSLGKSTVLTLHNASKVNLVALFVVAPVADQVVAESVAGCGFEEARRDNLVGVDVFKRQRHAGAFYDVDFLFHFFLEFVDL